MTHLSLRRLARLAAAVVLALAAALLAPAAAHAQDDDDGFTRDFDFERCSWRHRGGQTRYFPLIPGYRVVLEGEEEDDGETVEVRVQITVLRSTRRIEIPLGGGESVTVNARVVEEREWVDDELVEVSRNWFARCVETNDLFYFGEIVDNYEDGEVVDHGGSWIAGQDGALPGILMPGRFLLGSRYYQEWAPGVALDRGENVAMGLTVETEAGTFHDCVEVLDSDALHPESEGDPKVYCPNVGLVQDEDLVLVERGLV
jgi:hypothetical protein